MKQVKSIFMTALAALAFAACNNDEVVEKGSPGDVPTGEETYVSFSFKVEGSTANTRAADTPIEGKTDAEEEAVTDGRILIFDEASGALLNNHEFKVAEGATSTIKTTSGSRRIYIITGTTGSDKTQINARLAALQTTAPASTLAQFYALMTDGKYTGTTADDSGMGTGFKELPVASKFVMSNVADITAIKTLHAGISKEESNAGGSTVADPLHNRFMFKVQRAVAKANLKVEMNKGTDLQTADGIFTLKENATYGLRNLNRGTLYVQQFINDRQTVNDGDHSAANGLQPHAAFFNVFDETSDPDMKKLDTYLPYYYRGYPIKDANSIGITMKANGGGVATPGKSVYISENSNKRQVRGNTTYFGITTQVQKVDKNEIAASIKYDDGLMKLKSEPASADFDNTTGDKSFWYVREIPANVASLLAEPVRKVFVAQSVAFDAVTIIFKNAPIALTTEGFTDGSYTATQLMASYNKTVNSQGDASVTSLNKEDVALVDKYIGYYKNGLSYYRLNLYETTNDDTRRHLVRRNHFYNATVTGFSKIGEPTEEDLDKDPEKPVDADVTYVTAIIEVAPWHNVKMEDDL